MPKNKQTSDQIPLEQYQHSEATRINIPHVGLVDAQGDPDNKKTYAYDPHIDPQLQWAGKTEHTAFDVPTVSLHVHERIDPRQIIDSLQKEDNTPPQGYLFDEIKKPYRQAVEFYQHPEGWTNRLVAGDSLLVMNSLLEKEAMSGKVQMIYFDPPYGIKYGSNFQPFVNKREVKDGKDEDLTAEPEMIKAFRDTWELGIHSYLTYLRDRINLAHQLLSDSGSLFIQISDENVHRVRLILDEIFGAENFVSLVVYQKTAQATTTLLANVSDFILWYAKNKSKVKHRNLYVEKIFGVDDPNGYTDLELEDGIMRKVTYEELLRPQLLPKNSKAFKYIPTSSQTAGNKAPEVFEYNGQRYTPEPNRSWSTSIKGLQNLAIKNRLIPSGKYIAFKKYFDDFAWKPISNVWTEFIGGVQNKVYVVQTNIKVIERCMLMTTDPGDLVIDITCGSGTTAYVAEQWGRRWLTCDTSRVAITLSKQRLLTALFDYYDLAFPDDGISKGFRYKTVPHITLKSIANNEPPPVEVLYDQPLIDQKRRRVTGPFTVEAVPAPMVKGISTVTAASGDPMPVDNSIARSGATLRQNVWLDELRKSGVRGKGGERIELINLETLSGTYHLHAIGETKGEKPQRIAVCFGPEFAPFEQRSVELALYEARMIFPHPEIILFCAFQFDPEAAKDIDELKWDKGTLLRAQMNPDLFMKDLKKSSKATDSFWLMGQPDVLLFPANETGKYQVEVLGFDYYNPKTSQLEKGSKNDIAMWLLDHNYDGRSLLPSQVFFPISGSTDGWSRLAKNLKATLDEDKIAAFGGTVSLPFEAGKMIAVKVIDTRGIESLKIIRL